MIFRHFRLVNLTGSQGFILNLVYKRFLLLNWNHFDSSEPPLIFRWGNCKYIFYLFDPFGSQRCWFKSKLAIFSINARLCPGKLVGLFALLAGHQSLLLLHCTIFITLSSLHYLRLLRHELLCTIFITLSSLHYLCLPKNLSSIP